MWGRFTRPSRWTFLLPAAVGAWIAIRIWQAAGHSPEDLAPESLVEGDYRVVRVIDGDTFVVAPLASTGSDKSAPPWEARIRLIGIDTPETVHPHRPVEAWGAEAKEFTSGFLSGGEVHLRFDKRRRDRYDRFVAYAVVGDRVLNEELLRAGLARFATLHGETLILARQMKLAETGAKSAQRGIWSEAKK